MVDILLIQPPLADFYLTAKRTIPYGLASIAAVMRQQGHTVAILDAMATGKSRPATPPEGLDVLSCYYGRSDRSPFCLFHQFRHYGYSFEYIGRQIKQSRARIVGIASLFTAYSDLALEVARLAKASLPDCIVVLGGHHPTALPEAVMAEPAVDLVLRGEGEIGLPALTKTLFANQDLANVPGIVFRRADGSLHIGEPAVCEDLDRLPPPAWDLVRRNYYRRAGGDSIVITASRGCPLECSYCATGRRSWMGYRRRSVAAVLHEIDTACRGRRVGFIDFEDENLTTHRRWFLELMQGMRDRFGDALPELRAMNGLYPPTITDSVVRAMRRGGFRTLNLSLGSADPGQLRRFNRPDVRRAFDQALRAAAQEGLSAVGYIIVAAPNQGPQASVDDLLFLARRRVLAGVSVFYPAPGSEDFDRCEEKGMLPPTVAGMRATALPIDQRTSRTDAATLLRLGRVLNFIKHLEVTGTAIPRPAPVGRTIDPGMDRIQVGLTLLAAFFKDGGIRGVDADGRVYVHRVSPGLCRRFLEGLPVGSTPR